MAERNQDARDLERDDLRKLESVLRGFEPRSSTLDRGRMMYLAGRESVRTESRTIGWLWPASTAATALVAVLFAVLFFTSTPSRQTASEVPPRMPPPDVESRPPRVEAGTEPTKPSVAREDVELPEPTEPYRPGFLPASSPRPATYFAARRTVLTAGVEAMPIVPVASRATTAPIPSPASYRTGLWREADVGNRQPTK